MCNNVTLSNVLVSSTFIILKHCSQYFKKLCLKFVTETFKPSNSEENWLEVVKFSSRFVRTFSQFKAIGTCNFLYRRNQKMNMFSWSTWKKDRKLCHT